MKLKYKLPACANVDHLNLTPLELNELKKIVLNSNNEFKSVLESNKKLCEIHHELSKLVYKNFFQISLTDSPYNLTNINLDQCDIGSNKFKGLSGFKLKKNLSNTKESEFNEQEYNLKTEFYLKYQELFNNIMNKFKAVPTRIRLVKLEANTSITPHIDYDPSYSVRIIIPIISDIECLNLFWVKNKIECFNFIEGNAYFLNTGYKHAVINFSTNDRYTLMISLEGINDIENLLQQ